MTTELPMNTIEFLRISFIANIKGVTPCGSIKCALLLKASKVNSLFAPICEF